jgi:hypothetical protein
LLNIKRGRKREKEKGEGREDEERRIKERRQQQRCRICFSLIPVPFRKSGSPAFAAKKARFACTEAKRALVREPLIKSNRIKQTTEKRGIKVFFRGFPCLPWFQSDLINVWLTGL